jgi:hypothetical protein
VTATTNRKTVLARCPDKRNWRGRGRLGCGSIVHGLVESDGQMECPHCRLSFNVKQAWMNPEFDDGLYRRFHIEPNHVDLTAPPEYRYNLRVADRRWLDPEGFFTDAMAGGRNWLEAFKCAGQMIDLALKADHALFF